MPAPPKLLTMLETAAADAVELAVRAVTERVNVEEGKEKSVLLKDLFRDEIESGIDILFFAMGRTETDSVRYRPLDRDEVVQCLKALKVIRDNLASMLNADDPNAPAAARKVVEEFERHTTLFLKVAGLLKAHVEKPFAWPPQPDRFTVVELFPQILKWSGTVLCGYENNTFELSLTAGSKKYIFGSDADFYRARSDSGYETVIVIIKGGFLAIGDTPKIQQYRIINKRYDKYGMIPAKQGVDVPITGQKLVYRYDNMPFGTLIITWEDTSGIKMPVMPKKSGREVHLPVGVAFTMYNSVADLVWVS